MNLLLTEGCHKKWVLVSTCVLVDLNHTNDASEQTIVYMFQTFLTISLQPNQPNHCVLFHEFDFLFSRVFS